MSRSKKFQDHQRQARWHIGGVCKWSGITLLLAAVGCSGNVGNSSSVPGDDATGDDGREPGPGEPPAIDESGVLRGGLGDYQCQADSRPAPVRLRRLSHAEYKATLLSLLNLNGNSENEELPVDSKSAFFDTEAALLRVSPSLTEAYLNSASRLSRTVAMANVLPCSPTVAASEQDACARKFIEAFGLRAFRRPLLAEEIATYKAHYDASMAADKNFEAATRFVLRLILGSPHFLHRTEGLGNASSGQRQLNDYEAASALSYFLWGTMPDETLFAEAAAGRLHRKEELVSQVKRMLEDNKAKTQLRHFFDQWLHLEKLQNAVKDSALFPDFNDQVRSSMHAETLLFAEKAALSGHGGLATLLSASTGHLDGTLANFLGVDGSFGSASESVDLPGDRRAGVLTHPSFLTANAYIDGSSPVHRGIFVRHSLLCQDVPDPPADIPFDAIAPAENATTRERFAAHQSNPSCAACHQYIDPIGFALESFDAVGRHRSEDAGKPVDTSGEIVGTRATNGSFNGPQELAALLAKSADVQGCLTLQMFRFGFGRKETANDACSLHDAYKVFADGEGDFLALIAALVESDAFLSRSAPEESNQ